MNEEGLIQKVIEHLGKIMSRYTKDKVVFGDGYIEFTDRKIEVIPPDKVIITKDGWEVVSDTIDKQKVKKAIDKLLKEWKKAKREWQPNSVSIVSDLIKFKKELGLK